MKDKKISYKDEVKTIIKEEGVYGLTRGYSALFIISVCGMGIYFAFFDYLKIKMNCENTDSKS